MSEMRNDDISRRLRAANPVTSDHADLPSGRSIEHLMEETMASTTDEPSTQRRTRWRLMAAAAVVVAAAAGGGAYLANRDDGTSDHAKTVLALNLPKPVTRPGGPGSATCIVFSVDLLAKKQLAFSGTVNSITDTTVAITVDHWYKGGNADQVNLATPGDSNALREIAVNFEDGQRYLVSADDGVVSGCGYTAAYSTDLAQDFAKAFSS